VHKGQRDSLAFLRRCRSISLPLDAPFIIFDTDDEKSLVEIDTCSAH
jgi:hypothetical protein